MADIRVDDVMTRLVVKLDPHTTIHDAAQRLATHGISGAPVVVDGKIVGVVSEADLVRASLPPAPIDRGLSILDMLSIIGRGHAMPHRHGPVSEIMSTSVIQVPVGTSIWRAAEIMDRGGIKRLPVVDDEGHLIGIVSRSDLVRALARTDEEIAIDVARAIEELGPENFEDLHIEVEDGVATLSGTADRHSTHDIALRIAARTPGVIEVVDRLDHSYEESKNLRPQTDPKDPRLDWEKHEVSM